MTVSRKKEKPDTKEKIKIFGPAIVIVIVGFMVAYQFVAPAPPRNISIGTGSEKGAYFAYGKKYSELFAKEGISLDGKITAGSAENLKLLEAESDGVDIAFVQGGMGTLAKTEKLVSLGSLYFEPLWIFHRNGLTLNRLSDLKGLRIAVGEEGSGTKVLTMQLLGLNGITAKNTRLLSYESVQAAEGLLKGEVDVAFFVTTHRSSYLWPLLKSKSITLMGLERAEAYALRYHYLHVLKLPEGVIDFQDNIPSRDLTLVAPSTQLVARSDLHPALIELFLRTAEEVHKSGGGFERRGEFPAPKYLDFELSHEAKRFYQSGTPFLQRYLPFWVANFLNRMKIMLLPLVALLYPLFKLMPPIYRWRMRSRIYRWYSELETVDPEMRKEDLTKNLEEYLSVLDNLEEKVSTISVPLAFSEELYSLRLHIDMLRNKLYKAREENIKTNSQ
jgi:TRAP transporter TAXI family solute receptor